PENANNGGGRGYKSSNSSGSYRSRSNGASGGYTDKIISAEPLFAEVDDDGNSVEGEEDGDSETEDEVSDD
ncbi:MAG: hypothetical protein ACOC0A_01650, partial [Planctomycetota bacterium]